MRPCHASFFVLIACARTPAAAPHLQSVEAVPRVEHSAREPGEESSWSPGMTPPDNTAEALVAAAKHIRRIELFELDTMQSLGELDITWVTKISDALVESEVLPCPKTGQSRVNVQRARSKRTRPPAGSETQ
jgi:hypothetical protein